MANYIASARSNYFRVKDREAFDEWAESRSLGVREKDEGLVSIYSEDPDGGGWPSCAWDEDGEPIDVDFFNELPAHLPDGEVAILMEAGAEKLRYICGHAHAITSDGVILRVSLSDIYRMLTDNGYTFTVAEY